MSNPLETLKIDYWYKAVLAISTVLLIVSLTIPLQGLDNPTVALICLGGVFIGLGEWRNHPLQTQVSFNYKITGYPRRFTLIGTIFDCVGVFFICVGVYKLLQL